MPAEQATTPKPRASRKKADGSAKKPTQAEKRRAEAEAAAERERQEAAAQLHEQATAHRQMLDERQRGFAERRANNPKRGVQPVRETTPADILAVAFVVFFCILAAVSSQLDNGKASAGKAPPAATGKPAAPTPQNAAPAPTKPAQGQPDPKTECVIDHGLPSVGCNKGAN